MPLKKHKTHHRVHHEKRKRSKKFLKVYAPYIPLLVVVGIGILLSGGVFQRQNDKNVLAYATSISRQSLLTATNNQREKDGETDLSLNTKLSEAAQTKASDMAENNYWAHSSPDGHEPWYFIEQAGYNYSKAAENLAYGFGDSRSTVIGWMNSPEHRANLLDSTLNDVGFGIVNVPDYLDSGPQTLVVAMYARPAGAESNVVQNTVLADKQSKVSLVQSLSGGKAPWSDLLVGLLLGAAVMYLSVKHLRQLRRALLKSERFVVKHPLLDVTLLAIIILAAILGQTAGFVQ